MVFDVPRHGSRPQPYRFFFFLGVRKTKKEIKTLDVSSARLFRSGVRFSFLSKIYSSSSPSVVSQDLCLHQ